MHVISLHAENYKRLKAIDIEPEGSTVIITGKNAQGKSSVLDSIFAAVGGKNAIPSKPIRKGEQQAKIKLELGQGKEVELIVTRKFGENGSTSVTVEQANGARFSSPQTMLDQLIGSIAFDPLEFTRMKPEDQFNTVRKLVKLDVDIDELEGKNQRDFGLRSDVNREIKALRAQAAGITVPEDLPEQAIDTAALLQSMQAAGEHNAALEKRKAALIQTEREAESIDKRSESIIAQIPQIKAQIAQFEKQISELMIQADQSRDAAKELRARLKKEIKLDDPIDVSAIRQEIEQSDKINVNVSRREQRAAFELKAAEKEVIATKLTEDMEARTSAKSAAIRKAKMPIEGLAFGDKEILFQDLPLDQASQAERIRVSMAVAMALNPKLRVLTIKDGSLIDDEGLTIIQKMVADGDYQLWLERVGNDGSIGIVIEDGAVV